MTPPAVVRKWECGENLLAAGLEPSPLPEGWLPPQQGNSGSVHPSCLCHRLLVLVASCEIQVMIQTRGLSTTKEPAAALRYSFPREQGGASGVYPGAGVRCAALSRGSSRLGSPDALCEKTDVGRGKEVPAGML